MKKIFLFLFSIITLPTFCQGVSNVSTQELLDYNMDLGIRKIVKKIPDVVIPGQFVPHKFFGNLTTDTLIAAITKYVKSNLILTPDNKIIVRPNTPIELYQNFNSEPETATNYTWKGRTIYTQKFLINWASNDIVLVSGVQDMYYAKHVDVATNNVNGYEERYVTVGQSIEFNPTNRTIKAHRPALTTGRYAQQAEIVIQYTKQ